jgi:hypothetical protein
MKAGLSVDHSVREEAEKALGKYPFFAMARMMVAKAATKAGDPRAQGLRFLAALYAPHRQYYAFFIEDRVRPMVAPPPRIGGQEGEAPRQTPSKQEDTPSSSDEPGPAQAMPFSPAYLPRLQGQLKARLHLYRGLSQRLRQAIRLPPLPPPAILANEPSAQIPVSPEPAPHPAESELSMRAEPISSLPPEVEPSPVPHRLSPFLLTLQFELSDKPSTPKADAMPAASEEDALAASPPLSEASGAATAPAAVESSESEAASVSEEGLPGPSEGSATAAPSLHLETSGGVAPAEPELSSPAVGPSESEAASVSEEGLPGPSEGSATAAPSLHLETSGGVAPAEPELSSPAVEPSESEAAPVSGKARPEPISAFTRPYVPLENPEAPVSPSASASQTPAEPTAPEPISAFTRPYIPLENPEAPVAPSKIQPPAQEQSGRESPPGIFHSEHPIRLIILPEFDPEASIHLKVPEPGPAPSEEPAQSVTPSAPTPLGSVASSPEEATHGAPTLPPAWQSFLSEIERPLSQVAQEALPQTPHTLEKLRQAFIRYLLQARKERRVVQEPPPPSTAIEEVLRLLETFQPKGEETPSPPPLMSVPESEAPPPPPPIYTETMARLCWGQGDLPLAIEIYEKLKARHPEKAAYYEAQIMRIQRGEQP